MSRNRIEDRVAVVRFVAELRARRDQGEPGWLAHRQRPQDEIIDQGEDRRIRANAKSKREDGDTRDDGCRAKRPDREPEILEQRRLRRSLSHSRQGVAIRTERERFALTVLQGLWISAHGHRSPPDK